MPIKKDSTNTEVFDFDSLVDRTNTSCIKWDFTEQIFGEAGLLAMWVADMDFQAPHPVLEAIKKRAEHPVFGYTGHPKSLFKTIIEWNKKRHGWNINEKSILLGSVTAAPPPSFPGESILKKRLIYNFLYYFCIPCHCVYSVAGNVFLILLNFMSKLI